MKAGLLLAAGLLLPAAACAAGDLAALQVQADRWVEDGYDRSADALAAIEAALGGPDAGEATAKRTLLLARGLVAARAGRAPLAESTAAALRGTAAPPDPLGRTDASLVMAQLEEVRGHNAPTTVHAQAAADGYESLCAGAPPARTDCDWRAWWRALQLLNSTAWAQGNVAAARTHARAAYALAERHADATRQAIGLANQAVLSARAGEVDLARRQFAQAQRKAAAEGAPELLARMKLAESRLAKQRDDGPAAQRALEEALPLARAARSPRLEAVVLGNLSDHHVMRGRPREALAAIERALPIVRSHNDERNERVLLHNATLARIGLGQLAEAKRDLTRLLFLWSASGGAGDQAIALREFGDALGKAGDTAGALELYHRERRLAADIMAANRETALRELRNRFDREAQQRNIELLERDNALKETQLANRALAQRIWALVAAMLGLAAVLLVLLVRRVRETHRQLAQSHARLRVQSECDPLTGLANRRHFQDVMRERGADLVFEGALLLVDIDHFKQVNDQRGHAVGDQVLLEVARRLTEAVRAGDLLVRWGGEEFLVFAPAMAGDALEQLAARMLQAVGGTPLGLPGGVLHVTASIGYAGFPLPAQPGGLTWERAVNLVDLALYGAKNQGRNRAVGIAALQVPSLDALHALESDFEAAGRDGRVELRTTPGPQAAAASLTPDGDRGSASVRACQAA